MRANSPASSRALSSSRAPASRGVSWIFSSAVIAALVVATPLGCSSGGGGSTASGGTTGSGGISSSSGGQTGSGGGSGSGGNPGSAGIPGSGGTASGGTASGGSGTGSGGTASGGDSGTGGSATGGTGGGGGATSGGGGTATGGAGGAQGGQPGHGGSSSAGGRGGRAGSGGMGGAMPRDTGGAGVLPLDLTLTSTALTEGGQFPANITCADSSMGSPDLTWTAGPSGTNSYAITLTDLTFNGLVHWAIWNIPSSTMTIPARLATTAMLTMPAGAQQVAIQGNGYYGPCPSGSTHTYQFRIYAIAAPTLPGAAPTTAAAAKAAIIQNAISSGILTGTSNATRM